MKIDLRKLYGLGKININENVVIGEDLYSKMGVRSMSEVLVSGNVSINYEENIELDLNVSGTFIMPCAITLEDVEVPFQTKIEEEISGNNLNNDFFLDLLDILWENIVLEIPLKVVKEGVELKNLEGQGWKVINED